MPSQPRSAHVIGWLRGRVVRHLPNGATVIDVRGVGYEVRVAGTTAAANDEVELFIHTLVRADALELYGFATFEEREFFELLLATHGVGPSTALGALVALGVVELARAIEGDDVKRVATVPGIGLKTASRIVLELKGKVLVEGASGTTSTRGGDLDAVEDALRALGYSSVEIRGALDGVELPSDESAALREALQRLRRS